MLNFRNTSIVVVLLLAALIICDIQFTLSAWWYVLLAFLYSLILFYGSYYVGSNFYIPITCSADITVKQIAISFDDGPMEAYTPAVLNILKEFDVPAAFFCIGHRIPGREALLRQLHAEGHLIGNHSYSHHALFDLFSAAKMQQDLQQMDNTMEAATGLKPLLFRPPYGVTNPNLAKAIRKGGYTPIGWNIRSLDTVIKDEQQLLEKVTKSIKPGAIVLFHDTSKTTLAILPSFIRYVTAQGYSIVRLDKMLNLNPYA
ncbi:MAG: polysaccharide deacetylase family protein [Chitinophagaceae bacterium]